MRVIHTGRSSAKGNTLNVDNLSEAETKRRELVVQIHKMRREGRLIREIARLTGKERRTVRKYLEGDPDVLCRSKTKSILEQHINFVIKSIEAGLTASSIVRELPKHGYTGTDSYARQFITETAGKYGLNISKYSNSTPGHDGNGRKKAVASPLSNGFVEGTNNKLKMVKRTMYGRCTPELLEAKMMYNNKY